MYDDLRIKNFRGLRSFTMSGLGRINLLVGPNNCGKTTVLEALDLLTEIPDPVVVGIKCLDRGAVAEASDPSSIGTAKLRLRHLFFGHEAHAGSEFLIAGTARGIEQRLRVALAAPPTQGPKTTPDRSVMAGLLLLESERHGGSNAMSTTVPLTANAEWLFSDFRSRLQATEGQFGVPFIPPCSLSRATILESLAAVALNPDEQLILDVLRLLEPNLERIVAIPAPILKLVDDRSGIFVKLKGQRERIPIGSLGEGMWRLLGLAIALVKGRGKILLVDEIDIGLHYSAQVDMWKMVKQAAEALDVQVFATTHSRDCIEALARLARPEVTDQSAITIQRIEGPQAVAYNERELYLAAERGIEVR